MTNQQANQEAFDWVYAHLVKQGEQSVNAAGHCQYRGLHGRSCAMGCLIPDRLYDPEMEGTLISTLLVRFTDLAPVFDGLDITLLAELQVVHDQSGSWTQTGFSSVGHYNMRDIAKKYQLTVTPQSAL